MGVLTIPNGVGESIYYYHQWPPPPPAGNGKRSKIMKITRCQGLVRVRVFRFISRFRDFEIFEKFSKIGQIAIFFQILATKSSAASFFVLVFLCFKNL